jgi:hypothetical protein
MSVEQIERLTANARHRSHQTMQRAHETLTAMATRGDAVTVARLAQSATVHAHGSTPSPNCLNGSNSCARPRLRDHQDPPPQVEPALSP